MFDSWAVSIQIELLQFCLFSVSFVILISACISCKWFSYFFKKNLLGTLPIPPSQENYEKEIFLITQEAAKIASKDVGTVCVCVFFLTFWVPLPSLKRIERMGQGMISFSNTSIVSPFPTEIYSVFKKSKAGWTLLTLFAIKYGLLHLSEGLLPTSEALLPHFLRAVVND